MSVDATRQWPEEGFTRRWPTVIKMPEDVQKASGRPVEEGRIEVRNAQPIHFRLDKQCYFDIIVTYGKRRSRWRA